MEKLTYIIENPFILLHINKLEDDMIIKIFDIVKKDISTNEYFEPFTENLLYYFERYLNSKSNVHFEKLIKTLSKEDFLRFISLKPSLVQYSTPEQLTDEDILNLFKNDFQGYPVIYKKMSNYFNNRLLKVPQERIFDLLLEYPKYVKSTRLSVQQQQIFIDKFINTPFKEFILDIKDLDYSFFSIAVSINNKFVFQGFIPDKQKIDLILLNNDLINNLNINDEVRIALLEADISLIKYFNKKHLTPKVLHFIKNIFENKSTTDIQKEINNKITELIDIALINSDYELLLYLAPYDSNLSKYIFKNYTMIYKHIMVNRQKDFELKLLSFLRNNPNMIKFVTKDYIFKFFEELLLILSKPLNVFSKKTLKRFVYVSRKLSFSNKDFAEKIRNNKVLFRPLELKLVELYPHYVIDFKFFNEKHDFINLINLAIERNPNIKKIFEIEKNKRKQLVDNTKKLLIDNSESIINKENLSSVEREAINKMTNEELLNIKISDKVNKKVLNKIISIFNT